MGSPQPNTVKFGLPFRGYRSSAVPHLVDVAFATSDGPSSTTRRSQNWRFNALEGKFYRREGTARVGASNGVLEDGSGEIGSGGRCRHMIPLRSSSLTSGYPTYCTIWTDEANVQGVIHFYSSNDNGGSPFGDTTLGDEFSTTTNYPITAAGGVPYSRCWPYVRTSDDTVGRFHSLATRTLMTPGSRNMIEFNDRVYVPSLKGVPWKWFKTFNDVNTDTGDFLRVHHTGRPSPLGMATITTGTIGTKGSWHEGDEFFISVAYRYRDGSVSMPIIPRQPNDQISLILNGNMTGFGKVSLARSGAGFTDRYNYLSWSNIPIGPPDVEGRYLLRTPKLNGDVAAGVAVQTGSAPSPLDLRITAYIPNNTQTDFQDPNGNDLGLIDDPLLVRYDHIMQPPSRYLGTCDGRVIAGYTNPNPVAIYLAPRVNVADGDATIDDVVYTYSLTGGTLTLNKDAGSLAIANLGDNTVQQVVDIINNLTGAEVTGGDYTKTGAGAGKWFATHAPGADLQATFDDIGTAADNDNVVSITGATNFSGDGNGVMRAWSTSFPAVIFFSSTYLAAFTTAKNRVFFTMGSPGMPPMAADSWAAGNYRNAPSNYGDFMGSGPLLSGAVCCFSRGIMVLQNRKAGVSGEDDDYRLYELNPNRGCISAESIVAFNGAVGYMTTDGYIVTDGNREIIISGDVWNSGTGTGEWAYEIAQSVAAVGTDDESKAISSFHASSFGGRIYIHYRLNSTFLTTPKHRVEYDFTGSSQLSGLGGLLQPDGTPWGWSTPLLAPVSFGAMVELQGSTGQLRYAAMDGRVVAMTATGRIYQIEVGPDDDGTDFTSNLWTARSLAGALQKKSHQEVQPLYKKSGTGVSLALYRDGLGTTADVTMSLATTGSNNYDAPPLPLTQAARCPARQHEYLWSDDGSGTDAPQIWGHEVKALLLDSYS